MKIMGSMGIADPAMLSPHLLRKKVSATQQVSYAELYEWLQPNELIEQVPQSWAFDWAAADADSFRPIVRS